MSHPKLDVVNLRSWPGLLLQFLGFSFQKSWCQLHSITLKVVRLPPKDLDRSVDLFLHTFSERGQS